MAWIQQVYRKSGTQCLCENWLNVASSYFFRNKKLEQAFLLLIFWNWEVFFFNFFVWKVKNCFKNFNKYATRAATFEGTTLSVPGQSSDMHGMQEGLGGGAPINIKTPITIFTPSTIFYKICPYPLTWTYAGGEKYSYEFFFSKHFKFIFWNFAS